MPESPRDIVNGLWNENVNPLEYGSNEKYCDHLMEQYKLYVEMTDRISARRNLANTFFLTIHTMIIGGVGYVYTKTPELGKSWIFIIPLIAAIALCFSWWRLVKSYRQLTTAKYKVIGEFEKRLPASPNWSAEWNALGKGKEPKLYRPLTIVENWVPLIFAFLYISATIIFVLQ